MVLGKATWVEAWSNLKRAHKDKRARRHLLGLSLLALIPIFCLAYIALLVGTKTWYFVPFLIPILWWHNRRAKQESTPLHIAPTPEPITHELTKEERRVLRLYFAEAALLHAVMVDRVGSERFLKENQLPAGKEVTSRRVHLQILKDSGIWDKMAAPDREAMMMPDGHWEWETINRVALAMEPLRLLRWILRIDYFLPVVGQQLSGDFGIAHELVLTPHKILNGKGLIELETMTVGRDAADHFFQRCLAEAISRGYYDPNDEEITQRARSISQSMAGQQNNDFVLGTHLVSEAKKEELVWATSLAQRRRNFLSWTIAMMEDGEVPDPPFGCIVED